MNLQDILSNQIAKLKSISKIPFTFIFIGGITGITLLNLPIKVQALVVGGIKVGEVSEQDLQVNKHCTWDQSESGQAIYAARDDEIILGFTEILSSTWEGGGYDTDKLPPKYNYSSYSKTISDYRNVIDAQGQDGSDEYKARLQQELSTLDEAIRKLSVSHSTFQIDWRCKGSGNFFDQKRGKVHVVYRLTIMKLPTPQVVETYFGSIPRLSVAESEDIVRKAYCRVLARPADSGGLKAHAAFQRKPTGTTSGLIRAMLFSDEYRNQYAASTWVGNIKILYDRLLAREATNNELLSGQAELKKGNAGFDALVNRIIASSEYQNKFGDYKVPGNGRPGCY